MIDSAVGLFVLSRFRQFKACEIDAPDIYCGGFNRLFGNGRIDVGTLFVLGNFFPKAVRTTVGSKANGGFVNHAFAKKAYPPCIGRED